MKKIALDILVRVLGEDKRKVVESLDWDKMLKTMPNGDKGNAFQLMIGSIFSLTDQQVDELSLYNWDKILQYTETETEDVEIHGIFDFSIRVDVSRLWQLNQIILDEILDRDLPEDVNDEILSEVYKRTYIAKKLLELQRRFENNLVKLSQRVEDENIDSCYIQGVVKQIKAKLNSLIMFIGRTYGDDVDELDLLIPLREAITLESFEGLRSSWAKDSVLLHNINLKFLDIMEAFGYEYKTWYFDFCFQY